MSLGLCPGLVAGLVVSVVPTVLEVAEVVRRHRVTVGHERDVAAGGLPPALDHGRYPLREVAVPQVVLVPHSGPHQVDSVEGVGGVYAPRAVGVVVAGLVELLGEVR